MNLFLAISALGLLLVTFPSCGQSIGNRSVLGESHAREQVHLTVKAANKTAFYKPLITTKALAIAVAEPMLFSIYGKENIISQRPYEVYLVDGVWYIGGTLPKDHDGGTFEIMVEASNSRVLALTHGK